jgi:HEAT repeat protein
MGGGVAAGERTLEQGLGSDDAEERRQATAELGGLPEGAAVPLLLRALGDEDWRVRKEATLAARALGAAPALIEALVEALGDGDNVGLRNAAVDVLQSVGAAATPALAGALGHLDADGRKLCVEVLGKGRDPAALTALGAALDDPDENVRQGALEAVAALGALSRDRAARVLLSRLDDADHVVRLTALSGLTALAVPIPWERLAPLVEDPTLRPAALSAAALVASPEAARALGRVLAGARGNAFDLALTALGQLADGPHRDSVAPALAEGGAELGRRLVAAALPDGRGDDALPRRAIALRLGALAGAPGVVDAAVLALAEDALAETAQQVLGALGAAALPELVARLSAPDASSPPEARAALVDAVACAALPGDLPGETAYAAAAALRRAARDPERQVAVRALLALARLGSAEDLEIVAAATTEGGRGPGAAAETALAALAARFPVAARALARRLARDEGALLPAAIAIGAAAGSSPFEESDAAFLAQAATAGDPRARRAAVHAVAEVRAAAGARFATALEVLRISLADEEHEVRVAAARALGRLCTARDAPRASDVLDLVDRSGEGDLVAAAVRAIGEGLGLAYGDPTGTVAPPPELVPALGLFARGAPSPVAMAAVEALGQAQRAGAPSAVGALAAALDHPDEAVVKAALLKLSGAAAAPGALDALGRGLSHPQPLVRVLAVEMLAAAPPDDARRFLGQRRLVEPDRRVKEAIARALGPGAGAPPGPGPEGGG